jgi:hypothetical protein
MMLAVIRRHDWGGAISGMFLQGSRHMVPPLLENLLQPAKTLVPRKRLLHALEGL